MTDLILPSGKPRFGVFDDALRVNVDAYEHRTPMGEAAHPLAAWVGFKQFQYYGVISDELMFGCALIHLRHVAGAFAYVYIPGEGLVVERSVRSPLGVGVSMGLDPLRGESTLRFPGLRTRMTYEDAPRRKGISLKMGRSLKVDAQMDETAAGFEPMSLCTRIGRNGWVYAHKVAGVPVTGTIECKGRRYDLEKIGAYGHHDFSAGFMRRETFWNWACFSGESEGGQAVGINVSCGVNETSFSENCLWVDGKRVPLGLCHFDYDWDAPLRPWHITSADGAVDLRFQSEGQHEERLQLGFAASDFKQIFGRFTGTIRTPEGEVKVKRIAGFVEDQYAKW